VKKTTVLLIPILMHVRKNIHFCDDMNATIQWQIDPFRFIRWGGLTLLVADIDEEKGDNQ